jgi:hypothetical protein
MKITKRKLDILFKKVFRYGYCDGFNWATCSTKEDFISDGAILFKGSPECPYRKYGIVCSPKEVTI